MYKLCYDDAHEMFDCVLDALRAGTAKISQCLYVEVFEVTHGEEISYSGPLYDMRGIDIANLPG